MKKTNTKTKSPTPATKVPKSAKKSAVADLMTTLAETTAPIANSAPAVKPVASTPVQTKIIARADVGYGNALYVRGDGPGLSWNQGVPMRCIANDQWELTIDESARPIPFKVLLNDSMWCTGPDSTVASGATVTVVPEFP